MSNEDLVELYNKVTALEDLVSKLENQIEELIFDLHILYKRSGKSNESFVE